MLGARWLVLAVAASAPWAAGCGVAWWLDPTADDFPGKGGGGGAASGGGGTGGAACGPKVCPAPPDECQAATCIDRQCGSRSEPDGTKCGVGGVLECKGGACQCTDGAQCKPAACNDMACPAGTCEYTPAPGGTCGPDGSGTCGADGLCGLCDDGLKNGAEAGMDCGGESICGACPGEPCGTGGECAGGFCVDGVCCDTACGGWCVGCVAAQTGGKDGTCGPITPGVNDPDFPECIVQGGCGVAGHCLCDDGVKNGSETDVDCGGACGTTCTIGQQCGASGDCAASNPCVDGVCCNSPCDGECASCALPGLAGLCSPLTVTLAGECNAGQQCNGDFSCKGANGQTCASAGECASGVCSTVCKACDAANPCSGGKPCVDGLCALKSLGQGETCLDTAQCNPGLTCVDGVCCESACDGLCMACRFNYTVEPDGTCAPMLSGYDPQNECDGPGAAAECSGSSPDANGDSSCGQP